MRNERKPVTVWIVGDQLTPKMSALDGLGPSNCRVLMIESLARAKRRPYHRKKLILVWSAMRHFAEELRAMGYEVDYRRAEPCHRKAVEAHAKRYRPREIRMMETAEFGTATRLRRIVQSLRIEARISPNNMFVSDRTEFARKAGGTRALRMESFYRDMRRRTGLLMNGSRPEGGRWNYDKENRRVPPPGHVFPPIPGFRPDRITRDVLKLVEQEFSDGFGELDGFCTPVTRHDAEAFLDDFIENRLDLFGPYEDAIVLGERGLYHSLLSPLTNLGLLAPLDICRRAEEAYRARKVRLASVEGLIRQIIGWREFVYQIYHLRMPGYTDVNALDADLPLPDFYWSGETRMRCVADAISLVRRYGLNHHIQRLMVTGNFALIAGIAPRAVNEWYWSSYLDAFEWVVSPNVLGLTLWADGGLVASKPYAASGRYIDRMSNCCKACPYDPKQTTGTDACPFNALYWDFLARNASKLQGNPRMKLMFAALRRRDAGTVERILTRAAEIRHQLDSGEL